MLTPRSFCSRTTYWPMMSSERARLRSSPMRLASAEAGSRLGDLIVAPAPLDPVFHLGEAALARRGDARDLVPGVAAAGQLHGVVLDADVGGKNIGQQVDAGREKHPGALRVTTGAVDRLDGERMQAELLRDLREQIGRAHV